MVFTFIIASRIFLRRFMKKCQNSFRNSSFNPQVKNIVTFKTLTYFLFLLFLLSSSLLSAFFRLSEPNQVHILVMVNTINIISNIFLLSYLFHNQEAVDYVKMKYCQQLKSFSKLFSCGEKESAPAPVFTIRPHTRKGLVTFSNDLEIIEINSVSS